MNETRVLRFGGEDGPSATLRELSYPHADALALYTVDLQADGLNASAHVEGIIDDGLADFFADIGESRPWDGHRSWRALTCISIEAECNDRGNVTLLVSARGRAWDTPWTATCSVDYDLGGFRRLAAETAAWFERPEERPT